MDTAKQLSKIVSFKVSDWILRCGVALAFDTIDVVAGIVGAQCVNLHASPKRHCPLLKNNSHFILITPVAGEVLRPFYLFAPES
jgi:hypothetical protein